MKKYEVKPNGQTYVCLLNACAAAGQLDPVYVSSLVIQLFSFSFQWLCLLLFTIIVSEGMFIVWRFDILYELYVPFQKRRRRKRRAGEGCRGLSWGNKSILLCRSWDRVSGVIFLCQLSYANCWIFLLSPTFKLYCVISSVIVLPNFILVLTKHYRYAIVRDMTAAGAGLDKFCYAGLITAHTNKIPRADDTATKVICCMCF